MLSPSCMPLETILYRVMGTLYNTFRIILTRSPGNLSQQNTENSRNLKTRARKHFLVTPFSVHTSNTMLFESLTQKPFWFNLGGGGGKHKLFFSLLIQSLEINIHTYIHTPMCSMVSFLCSVCYNLVV